MSQPRWDFFIAHGDASRDEARALHALLARDAKVFSRAVSLEPGENLSVASRALADAGVVVVLLARDGDLDRAIGDDLTAAIERMRDDPSRCFIPVYLDAEAARRKRYGTATTQGLSLLRSDDRPQVVAALRARVAALRGQWAAQPRVALVGVASELNAYLLAASKRLPSRATVTLVDAAAPDAVARARESDLRVVFVGGRTGGRDTLGTLVRDGALALKLAKVDPDEIPDDEFAALKPIRRSIDPHYSFATEDEAAARTQDLFADWLKAWVTVATGAGAALEPWERAYLRARHTKWKTGSHEGLREASRGKTLDRAKLYVPLRAVPTETAYVDAEGALVVLDAPSHHTRFARKERQSEVEDFIEGQSERGAPWLEALVTHRSLPSVVVEAAAGAGKTVLLQHIACVLTSMHLGEACVDNMLDVTALTAGAPMLRVPLLVEARRLAASMTEGTLSELLAALAREVTEHGAQPVDPSVIRDGLMAGRYLVLVDSLDEVPGVDLRAKVLQSLDALLAQRWASRVILTTRPTAHTGLAVSERFRLVQIAALDNDRATAIIERWADAMGEDATYRREAGIAVTELRTRQGAGDGGLVANPLLLTCALIVYDQQRLLPDSLADLYERLVEILCRAKTTTGYTYDAKRELVERVCDAMQRAGGTALEVRAAAEVILRASPELGTVGAATELLDRLAADTGLLRFESVRDARDRRERRVVRPWHRSFQEFLAARRLASGRGAVTDETDRLLDGPNPIALDPTWENALTFLVGVYGNQGTERARAYAERLADHGLRPGAARPGRLLGLAARAVAEYRDLFRDGALRDRLRRAIADSFARDGASWPLRDRLLALEALGRIDDPRLEGDWWVEVLGGTFTFGDGKSYQSRKPERVAVAGFRMAWRPVTVEDYAPFVASGAYGDATFWEGVPDDERFDEPRDWAAQRFHPNRPVVGVSLHEALAWCRWASGVRRETLDLPTEIEWEYAARGAAGDGFPWGEDAPGADDAARANYQWGEGAVGSPSPVGAFPRGDRGRLVDLAGNVWEWTKSPWEDDDNRVKKVTSGSPRVVRGGAWGSRAGNLRCATRVWDHPRNRSQFLGFRVVVRGSRQPP